MLKIHRFKSKIHSRYRSRSAFDRTTTKLMRAIQSAQSAAILDGLGLNK